MSRTALCALIVALLAGVVSDAHAQPAEEQIKALQGELEKAARALQQMRAGKIDLRIRAPVQDARTGQWRFPSRQVKDSEVARQVEVARDLKAKLDALRGAAPKPAAPAPTAPAVLPPAPGETPPKVTYKGQERPAAWFETQYAKFRDKVAVINGKYVDVGKALLDLQEVAAAPPEPGTEVRRLPPGARVQRVLSVEAVLARRPGHAGAADKEGAAGAPDLCFYLEGIDARELRDNGPLGTLEKPQVRPAGSEGAKAATALVVYAGPHTYREPLGAERTVQRYRCHVPLSREQFAAALADGLELVEYSRVKGAAPGEKAESGIVAKPVP